MGLKWAIVATATVALAGCGESSEEHKARLQKAGPNPTLESLMKVASVEAGSKRIGQCAACHSLQEGAMDRGGPNLYGVFGKKFGENSIRFGYTAAMANTEGHWNAETLNTWMIDPHKVIPGTRMPLSPVSDPLDRADIIAFLQSQTQKP